MSTNEKKPRRTFDREFIESAVKLVTSEGYSLAAAAKAVSVSYPKLRQWCQKHAAQNGPAADKVKLKELEEENRQLRRQLRQAELEREILKKATAYFAKDQVRGLR
jgi:transposase